jgi:hypothetical protein
MNLKALTLGAVAGLFFALVPSCGPAKCGPQNCDGCCDVNGACVPKTASGGNSACGTAGNACVDCSAMAMTCQNFVCAAGGTGGGTGGGSTGGGGGTTGGGGGTTGGGGGTTGGGGGTTGGGGGTTGGGGGTTGGGGGTTGCSIATQNCPTGQACLFADNQGNTTACFVGECDLVLQNCPTATDACNYVQFQDGGIGRACLPAGAGTQGQACSAPNGCAKGLLCLNGKCEKYCYTDSNCGGGSAICASLISVPGASEFPAACYTVVTCDPLNQATCTGGQGCYLGQSGPICAPAGTVAVNGTCTPQANCVPGAICIGGGTSGTCKNLCNLDGGTPNCGGAACQGLSGVPYGACP